MKDANNDLKSQLRKDKDPDKDSAPEHDKEPADAGTGEGAHRKKEVRISETATTDDAHHRKLFDGLKGVIDSNNNDDEAKESNAGLAGEEP